MLYLLCILFPPLAVLFTGRPGAFIVSLLLTLLGWLPGVIHAFFVVNDWKQEKRMRHLEAELRYNRWER